LGYWRIDELKPPIVEVEWIDANKMNGWISREHAEQLSLENQYTIGYLLTSDAECVRVAMSLVNDGNETVADVIAIPRMWINEIRFLED
jgi:hypothetical protein